MVFTQIFNWFMNLPYFWIILIISLVATVITTLIYKFTTNQDKLRKSKEEVKNLRKEMNKHKHDQKKMMEVQQKMMSKNMEMMKASFKPMIYTFIPLILLFSWMSASLAFEPLMPNQSFTVTATFSETYVSGLDNVVVSSVPEMIINKDNDFVSEKEGLKQIRWVAEASNEGTYQLLFESPTFKETKEIIITTEKKYANPVAEYKDSQLEQIVVGNKQVKPFKGVPLIKGFTWLWSYILLSVVSSIVFRKMLKIA